MHPFLSRCTHFLFCIIFDSIRQRDKGRTKRIDLFSSLTCRARRERQENSSRLLLFLAAGRSLAKCRKIAKTACIEQGKQSTYNERQHLATKKLSRIKRARFMQNLVLFICFVFNIFKLFTMSCIKNLGQNVFILRLSFCVFPDHIWFERTTPYKT